SPAPAVGPSPRVPPARRWRRRRRLLYRDHWSKTGEAVRCWTLTGYLNAPLRLENRPDPELGPGQVRVRLRAASLNYRDLIMADRPPRPGLIPVSDGAGDVVEVAPDVVDMRPGDRVAGGFFADWASGPSRHANLSSALGGDVDGVLSELVVCQATAVTKIPDALTFAEAATFPCAG